MALLDPIKTGRSDYEKKIENFAHIVEQDIEVFKRLAKSTGLSLNQLIAYRTMLALEEQNQRIKYHSGTIETNTNVLHEQAQLRQAESTEILALTDMCKYVAGRLDDLLSKYENNK